MGVPGRQKVPREKKFELKFTNGIDTGTTRSNGLTYYTMAPNLSGSKRKSPAKELDESEDEIFDGLLDGVLSESEDEAGSDDASSNADGGFGGAQRDTTSGDGESDDELHSDDIPSDVEAKLPADAADEDSDEEDGDKPNYRVTNDANGGIRYVYDDIDPYTTRMTPTPRRQRTRSATYPSPL